MDPRQVLGWNVKEIGIVEVIGWNVGEIWIGEVLEWNVEEIRIHGQIGVGIVVVVEYKFGFERVAIKVVATFEIVRLADDGVFGLEDDEELGIYMSTLAEFMIVAGADNRPPMLDKSMYESWKSRMELYIQDKDHGRIILNSVENIPLIWPTVKQENGIVRPKTYEELSNKEKLQADCDLKATNIVLQGTSLSKQERECKLYDEFDKFSHVKGETPLPLEWSKFVTDVKLARDLHTSNYDQLYAYLEQHEAHANEARLMRERFTDPLALVANYHQPPSHLNNYHSQYTTPQYQQQFSPPFTQQLHTQPSVSQNPYPPLTIPQQPQAEFPPLDSGLVVPTFLPGDDLIACMNKAMAFLSDVFSPRYPSTNNQLRSSSNLRNQATVQDGRVTVQQVQGRHAQNVVSSRSQGNASCSWGNTSGQAKVVKCYNCQGEGHMARQCTQPKRRRNTTWFKEKVLLVQAHAKGKELDDEQLAFLVDPGVADGQVAQTITHNAAFQTDDLDAYDSDCDDIFSAKAVLIANLSSCDSDFLSETLSKHVKEKKSLLTTLNAFKMEFKQRESKSINKEIVLENKNKELENIVSLRYQNPFYLKRAQRVKPTLYDGNVLSKIHDVIALVDDEETLILAEESRLKMVDKHNDPIMKKEKINITLNNYSKLNKLSEDFGKRFVPQQELSAEQMFWLHCSNKDSEEPHTLNTPVKIEVPNELPKVSLVHKSLKKLQFHLASFDTVVKVRTTPDAITEGSWGFEHTKKVFLTEIISWLNLLKVFFKEFDKGLHDEITEVQTVFTQMKAAVEQCSVDRKCCEIQQKQFLIEEDRLFDKIISQEIVNIVLNSFVVICDSEKKNDDYVVICNKCLELEAELVKKNDVYIELSKRFSNLEQHCISLEVAKQLNQEIFQKDKSCANQNDLEIQEYFEQNNLKVQLQAKDTVISILKETIHSLRENANPARVKHDIDEIETINIELEHGVAKLLSENEKLHQEKEHLKKTYKELYDSIKPTRVHAKEQCDSLIANLNSKSMENADLKAQIQEKVFANAALKNELRKLKGKNVIDTAVSKPNATTIAPGMFKLDLEPLAPKVIQIVLWYLDSGCSKHITKNRSQLTNLVNKFLGTVKFGNDQIAKIMGYGDYQIGNVTISKVYYVEGLGHNLFSVGQFCDSDLEVASRKQTSFVRNLKGVDLLTGYRGTNLYTLSFGDMMKSSLIYLLSKASKTKSWLWHRRLSHLNFGTINQLAKQGLVRGLPKLKFEKNHLCSACSLEKGKKHSHKPKSKDTN
ncbi:retrovirus-related pol polyprotein from transposon TNT 1-94 [Tanacetum coccineum]